VKNSVAWFKGTKPRDVLSELYSPTVKFARDQQGNVKPYPPTLKLQLKQRNGKFETVVYDDKKRPLTDVPLEDVLVKGTVMTALIQCTGVWFAGGKFGISWKAIQIRADKVPQKLSDYAFLGEDGDSASASASAPAAAAPPKAQESFASLHDDDEVDDDEALAPKETTQPPEEEEDDELPVPVPAKAKTVTAKKIVAKAAVKK